MEKDLHGHATEVKDTANKASAERQRIFEKLEEISMSIALKDSATNKRIDAWENKGAGAKWMAAIGISVISTIAGAAGSAMTFFIKYGGNLPR